MGICDERYYRIPYIASGKYVLKVTKEKHVEYVATIELEYSDVVHNVTLERVTDGVIPGDVNLDEIVTSVDSNLLKRNIAGTYYINNESAEFIAADINGDGRITATDSYLLKMLIVSG